jgi:hypothetical protein
MRSLFLVGLILRRLPDSARSSVSAPADRAAVRARFAGPGSGNPGLRVGDSFTRPAGPRLPRGGVESRLLQTGSESRQILAKISGQPAVRGSDGHENVAAAFGNAHLYPLLPISGYLQFDIVRRRGVGGLIRRAGLRSGSGSGRLRRGSMHAGAGTGRRLAILWANRIGQCLADSGSFRRRCAGLRCFSRLRGVHIELFAARRHCRPRVLFVRRREIVGRRRLGVRRRSGRFGWK